MSQRNVKFQLEQSLFLCQRGIPTPLEICVGIGQPYKTSVDICKWRNEEQRLQFPTQIQLFFSLNWNNQPTLAEFFRQKLLWFQRTTLHWNMMWAGVGRGKLKKQNIAQLNKCNQQLCFDGLGLDIGQITALSGIWYCDRLGGNGSLGICVALFGQIIVNVLSYHFWLTEDIEFENGRKLELVEIVLCSEEIWDNLISASSRTAKLLHIVRKPVQS